MRLPLADATVPAREVFRHFPPTLVVAFYLLSALARVVFVSGAWRRLAKYRAGRPAHRWGHGGERLWRAARTPARPPPPPQRAPPAARGPPRPCLWGLRRACRRDRDHHARLRHGPPGEPGVALLAGHVLPRVFGHPGR